MIKNEQRYKGKLLNYDEKYKIKTNISLNVYLLKFLFSLLIVTIGSVILIFFLAFINTTWASVSIVITIGSLILAVMVAFLLEREVISKELNDKLYIYFDLLREFIEEGKSKSKIRMVVRKLTRYLETLERNVNNVFMFKSSELDLQLVQDIKKILVEDLVEFLKRGKKELILELIVHTKDAYLCAEGLLLTQNTETVNKNEHSMKMDLLKNILKKCEIEKQSFTIETGNRTISKLYTKVLKFATNTYSLIAFFSIIGLGLVIYINDAEDYSKMPANLSVVGFFLMIIIFIIQSRKK
ncbi:hypothetical protein [Paenibacillus polymyxa]|uniref:hypothetical protein n=1 Tax=Paenibacillus polymyxa TaxID=1406 RepID=UPI002023DEBE|nr:hypothetical protein [Paenibacillus polymyxa]MDU8672526.1 hypothetical protein [Paenibacillus polymyxa]MDU8697433.1 hypothetical protein [Paenibacillus polymyxa]URJ56596.3 hypothetical protein MF623_001268 [Paenibacillus polymyxa]URJ64026.3 hypothetical protein MF620_003651 [Paenibacillus polymyxa]URJ71106.1 hypothetical protein MF624_001259 [Paenibacillus polymyxa]